MIEPVKKELSVPVPPDRAFEMFTKDIAKWWPVDTHSISASDGKSSKNVTLEQKLGGKIIEETYDGETVYWGEITDWQPGHKVEFTWHLRRPEQEQTLVSVSFIPDGSGTTVKLVHSGWEAQGTDAATNREQYQSGWDFVFIERFGGAFE